MLQDLPYRALARLCQMQAALAKDDRIRRKLERMAAEYMRQADRLDSREDQAAESEPARK